MNVFPPTIVIRHRKENLKKCSLRGLETRDDFVFYRYPLVKVPPFEGYIQLTLDAGEELSPADSEHGLLLLDATWRHAITMEKTIAELAPLKKRRLPSTLQTAYPRRQDDCPNPCQGLSSIEALLCAYIILGRSIQGLLDHYYWQDSFLEKNDLFLLKYAYEREARKEFFNSPL